jgi:iron(III) transport system permease protein
MVGMGEIVLNTLIYGLVTTFISVLTGIILAWITARTDTPLKGFIELVAILPFVTAPFIGAAVWASLCAQNEGLLNVFLMWLFNLKDPPFNIYSMTGMIFVTTLYVTPFSYLFTNAALKNMDPTLEEAAITAGASKTYCMFHITLPIVVPAIMAGTILSFVKTIEMIGIPGILGIPARIFVLTTYIWKSLGKVPPRFDIAAVLSGVIVLVAIILIIIQRKLLFGERSYVTMFGKRSQPKLVKLGKWKYLTLFFSMAYITLSIILPYAIILYGSTIDQWGKLPILSNLTLDNFIGIFKEIPVGLRALKNSLFLASIGATITMLLCVVVAYITVKSKIKGRKLLDIVSMTPLAIPGVAFAIGLIWAYIREPFMLYGTIWILLVAYVSREIPIGIRSVSAALFQLHNELEYSAGVCGATWFVTLKKIIIPLILPGIISGWILVFVPMMRELSMSLFLYSYGNETLSVAIFELAEDGLYGYLYVLALIIAAISLSALFFVKKVLKIKMEEIK